MHNHLLKGLPGPVRANGSSEVGRAALGKNLSVLIGREGGGYSPSAPSSGKNVSVFPSLLEALCFSMFVALKASVNAHILPSDGSLRSALGRRVCGFTPCPWEREKVGAALGKNVSVLIGREGGGYSPSTPQSGKSPRSKMQPFPAPAGRMWPPPPAPAGGS